MSISHGSAMPPSPRVEVTPKSPADIEATSKALAPQSKLAEPSEVAGVVQVGVNDIKVVSRPS
jgi:hypothetical protein